MAKHRDIPAPDPVVESETEDSEASESDSEPEPQHAKTSPAKLQKPLAKATPPAESSDSETEESDSEPEPQPAKKGPIAAPSTKAAAPAADSSSGSEYESDSDDGLPPKKPDSNGTSVKPVEKDALPVKTAAGKAAKAPASATPATGMKRSAAPSATQVADTKRSKVENSAKKGAATEEGKKLFERIFTVEDEMVVLEELLKKYPIAKESPEMDSVYEAIKARVSVPVSKAQVLDKMRRLKAKFFNKKEKFANKKKKKGTEEETGKDELYELSNKIWGNEEGPKTVSKGSTSISLKFEEAMGKVEGVENKKEKVNGKSAIGFAGVGKSIEDWVFGEGTELVAEEGRVHLEKQWKEVRKEETAMFVKRLELSLEHAKMVYDSVSS